MANMETVLWGESGQFQSFLNDFILNVYIPQVDQQINNYYTINIGGMEAYQLEKVHGVDHPIPKVN